MIKRCVDLLLSASALMFLLPLLSGLALAILLRDGRPIIFSELRTGRDQRQFTLYKFRTLHNACPSPSVATSDDRRLTRTGRFLRHRHLDELPQLLNVLRGDMSLVGPRPMKPEHAETLPQQTLALLLSVNPGLTGPAALKFLAEDEALAGYILPESLYLKYVLPAKAECQIDYFCNYSLKQDLRIVLHTARDLFSTGAYNRSREYIRALIPVQSRIED